MTGGWGKRHNEELRNLYPSQSINRTIKSGWAGYVAHGEKCNAYGILVGKPRGKRPLGRPKRSWVDDIKLDLGEIGRTRLGPVEDCCEHGKESSGPIKCWEILKYLHNWQLLKKSSSPWS
jgi:hypothetical protein